MISSQQGSFHQGNTSLFPTTAGKQCTCNALMALLYCACKPPEIWVATDLDRILFCGNSLYQQLYNLYHQDYLLLSELPSNLYIGQHLQTLSFTQPFSGFLNTQVSSPETGAFTLRDAITTALTTSTSVIYTVGDLACASTSCLMIRPNCVCIFDSHSRSHYGMPIPNGASVVLSFPDIASSCNFISQQHMGPNVIDPNIPFELMGVSLQGLPILPLLDTQFQRHNISLQHPILEMPEIPITRSFPRGSRQYQSWEYDNRQPQYDFSQNRPSTRQTSTTYVDHSNVYTGRYVGENVTLPATMTSAETFTTERLPQSYTSGMQGSNFPLFSERASNSSNSPPDQLPSKKTTTKDDYTKDNIAYRMKEGETLAEFHSLIRKGPTYVCCCCLRFLYRHSVQHLADNKYKNSHIVNQSCLPATNPETIRWICKACHRSLLKGIMPVMSYGNNMALAYTPRELSNLSGLEIQLISLIVPFMKIVAKPRGGQHGIKGPVILVPADLSRITSLLPRPGQLEPSSQLLPRPTSEAQIITLALKRRLSDTYYITKQYIRPENVNDALLYLIANNSLYQNVTFNPDWILTSNQDLNFTSQIDDDNNSRPDISTKALDATIPNTEECDEQIDSEDEVDNDNPAPVKQILQEKASINNATFLHPIEGPEAQGNLVYNLAPGEGQRPISVFSELHWEAMSFPHLFPDGSGTFKDTRPTRISPRKYVRSRIMSSDPRFAQSTPYIFLSLHWLEQLDVNSSIQFQLKKRYQGDIDAGQLKNPAGIARLLTNDHMYATFKKVRGTPQYWRQLQLDMLAKLRQLGNYSFFITGSSAEFHWPEIIIIVAKQYGEDITEDDVAAMSWQTKRQYLERNPVTVARHIDFIFSKLWNKVILGGLHPIGQILNFDRRLEMQARGTAHFHSAVHVQDAPILDKACDTDVIAFIDQYITCALPDANEDPQLFQLVNTVQRHHHTSTCRKKKGVTCRFHYPKPPTSKTVIAREEVGDNTHDAQHKSRALLKRVYQELMTCDPNSVPTLTNLLHSLSISLDEYQHALTISTGKTSIVYKRSTQEVYINNYNRTILKALRSNMDIQFISNIWACIAYLTSYMCKPERSMSEIMRKACKEAETSNVREQLKSIGQVFLKCREVSEHEAIYRITSTPLRTSNLSVTYVDTHYHKERARMLKSITSIKGMEDEDKDVFATNIHEKYAARPQDLSGICLAFFATNYSSRQYEENNEDTSEADENTSKGKMTSTIRLLHNLGIMRKRQRPTVLRYNYVSLHQDREQYYHRLLLLYQPWRKESELLHLDGMYESKFQEVATKIQSTIKMYEPHSLAVEEILETFDPEEMPNHLWDQMTSEVDQQHLKNHQLPPDVHFPELDPDLVENTEEDLPSHQQSSRKTPYSTSTEAKLMSDEAYLSLIRSLNTKQKLLHDLIYHWCIQTKLASITKEKPPPFFIFLSGGGGVGKSHLIHAIYQSTKRAVREKPMPSRGITGIDPTKPVILLTATTGKAASNIDGTTLHSAFALPVKEKGIYLTYKAPRYEALNSMRVELGHLKILVIDEISMLKSQDLHHLHLTMQLIFGSQLPFGGISILGVGDLMQLNPVGGSPVFEKKSHEYTTLAPNIWKDNFKLFELTEIVRQKGDPDFALLLSRLRVNKCTEEDYETLHNLQENNVSETAVHLFMTNAQVMEHNDKMLKTIDSNEIITIHAKDSSKDLATQSCSIKILDKNPHQTGGLLSILTVAVGAKFMLTKNINIADGLVNGASGTIVHLEINENYPLNGYIFVKFDKSNTGHATRRDYLMKHKTMPTNVTDAVPIESVTARFNLSSQASILVQRRQYPGTLAWALTTHKAQGSTYPYFVADMTKSGKQRSAPQGLIYTMLSRGQNSQGLKIVNFHRDLIKVNEKALREMERLQKESTCSIPSILNTHKNSNFPLVGLLNIRSYNLHGIDLLLDEAFTALNAICLTETYIKINTTTTILTKDDHQLICTPSRHGTSILVSRNCSYKIFDLSSISLQCTAILLSQGDNDIILISIYVPPRSNVTTVTNILKKMLSIIPHEQFPTIICGDFNQPSLGSQHVLDLFFIKYHLSQFVTEPTHNDGAILDRIYSNIAMCCPSHWPKYFSDHHLITIHPM